MVLEAVRAEPTEDHLVVLVLRGREVLAVLVMEVLAAVAAVQAAAMVALEPRSLVPVAGVVQVGAVQEVEEMVQPETILMDQVLAPVAAVVAADGIKLERAGLEVTAASVAAQVVLVELDKPAKAQAAPAVLAAVMWCIEALGKKLPVI